ncbi:hypothetical protein MB901379_03474 [Mycobacterium basiliense]|uniref:Twin-arginine translocation pathway signal n=1 Tax=Mycobacterium basiliense TaxID=2094119 RepID=A0A3S4BHL6_9MYCO|nr:hypothetical protein [Mycobacterium basiliense]VDM89888.1 hypothetical protein MB901379_03474 [Mycobacterium basiliense]
MTDDVRDLDGADATETTEMAAIDPEDGDDAEVYEEGPEAESDPPKRDLKRDLLRIKVNVRPLSVILTLLILISGGTAAWLYVKLYRPDQQVDPSVERAAVSAASDGTVALLSYSPDTLDEDFARARKHLTGDFLAYYNQFTEQFVAPTAKEKALKTSAHVVRAAVSELHPGAAEVLIFADQSTTSKDHPEPALTPISVVVSLARVDGNWLITKFTPVAS